MARLKESNENLSKSFKEQNMTLLQNESRLSEKIDQASESMMQALN